MFRLFLSSWARTLTSQDRRSRWQMWPFFQQLPLFSDLGECERFAALSRSRTNKISDDPMCGLSSCSSNVSYFRFCRLSAEHYPKLGEYHAMLKERPSIKASWPPHWLENPKGQDTLKDIWDFFLQSPLPVMSWFGSCKNASAFVWYSFSSKFVKHDAAVLFFWHWIGNNVLSLPVCSKYITLTIVLFKLNPKVVFFSEACSCQVFDKNQHTGCIKLCSMLWLQGKCYLNVFCAVTVWEGSCYTTSEVSWIINNPSLVCFGCPDY